MKTYILPRTRARTISSSMGDREEEEDLTPGAEPPRDAEAPGVDEIYAAASREEGDEKRKNVSHPLGESLEVTEGTERRVRSKGSISCRITIND